MRWFVGWCLSMLRWGLLSVDPAGLAAENLALRQQLATLQRGKRPVLRRRDRAFWILLARLWPGWKDSCRIVRPATVVRWHRAGFRAFWTWKSRRRTGRPPLDPELKALIRRLALENPRWGAPRIHGELMKLGFRVGERTVQKHLPRRPSPRGSSQSWKAFLANHRDHLAGMDFLVIPTWNFRQLYALVILRHGRREVAHVNVTAHPTAAWVCQQLREAFPGGDAPKHLVFDRDRTFGAVKAFVRSLGIEPKVTAFRSPWQNGVVERWVGSLRRDLLDHVIVRDEAHLRRLLKAYLAYYHEDRTHLALGKDSPRGRAVESRAGPDARVVGEPRLGGLHHRYTWTKVA